MHTIAEFKIETPGQTWEQTGIIKMACYKDSRTASKLASELADEHKAEVRWNWQGSLQGHYVGIPIASKHLKIIRVK